MTWQEQLRDLLCLLYRIWGGNCNDLIGKTIPQIRAMIAALLANPGVPEDPSELAKAASDINEHLGLNGNGLSEEEDLAAHGIVNDVNAAIIAAA